MATRVRTGADIWTHLQKDLAVLPPAGRPLVVSGALSVFFEATVAYDAGAFQLAALGCRAAVESGCYLFVTRRWTQAGWRMEQPRNLAGELRDVELEELKKAATALNGLTPKLKAATDRIQGDGNFIAHLARTIDRRTHQAVEAVLKTGRFSTSSVRSTVSQDEARANLEDAAKILVALESAHPSLPSFGPDSWEYGQDYA